MRFPHHLQPIAGRLINEGSNFVVILHQTCPTGNGGVVSSAHVGKGQALTSSTRIGPEAGFCASLEEAGRSPMVSSMTVPIQGVFPPWYEQRIPPVRQSQIPGSCFVGTIAKMPSGQPASRPVSRNSTKIFTQNVECDTADRPLDLSWPRASQNWRKYSPHGCPGADFG